MAFEYLHTYPAWLEPWYNHTMSPAEDSESESRKTREYVRTSEAVVLVE